MGPIPPHPARGRHLGRHTISAIRRDTFAGGRLARRGERGNLDLLTAMLHSRNRYKERQWIIPICRRLPAT